MRTAPGAESAVRDSSILDTGFETDPGAAIEGNRLVTHWRNRLPGRRADGTFYEAPGVSIFEYAGGGRFSSEMDLLNMVHVGELIRECGWKPAAGFHAPPRHPRR